MSNRASGYHQKGTQGLSEIRVQDMGHCQCWASFLSQRETVMFRECKRIVGVADLEESPRGLCKGPSIAKQAEVVGGKGFPGQRSASFQDDDELHLPWELPDNGIRDLVVCHIQLSPSPCPRNISQQTEGAE